MPVSCAKCGEVIDQSASVSHEERIQCPKCGSIARSFFPLSLHLADAITVSAEANVEVATYPETLLKTARHLIDSDRNYGIAIIVLHIACEITTDKKMSEAFARKGIQDLEDPVCSFFSGYNLANNDKIRKLYIALTGDDIQKQPFWQKFTESAGRRNQIIHGGRIVTDKAEAEASYEAVKSFLAHLNNPRP
jgi:hypothetical protein